MNLLNQLANPAPTPAAVAPPPMAPAPVLPSPVVSVPVAAPVAAAPAAPDVFSGMGAVDSKPNTPTLPAGCTALVTILGVEQAQSTKGGQGVIVKYRVDSCSDATQVGLELAWKCWVGSSLPQFRSNCKEFVRGAMGLGTSPAEEAALRDQSEGIMRAAITAGALNNRKVSLRTEQITTERGHAYNKHHWSGGVAG